MAANLCLACQKVEAEYVGYDQCAGCLGLTILSLDEGKDWIKKERDRLTAAVNELLSRRRSETITPILDRLDALALQEMGEGVNINFGALAALDAMREVLELPTNETSYHPNGATSAAAAIMLYDLGILRTLPFQLEQREQDVVKGIAKTQKLRPTLLADNFPLLRRDHLWTRWTQVAYNRGPDLPTEPDFCLALQRDDPAASVVGLAVKLLDIPGQKPVTVLPILAGIDRQTLKAFAPGISSMLARLSEEDLMRLQALLNALTKYADMSVGDKTPGLLRVSVRELISLVHPLSDVQMLSTVAINGQKGKTIPLASREGLKVTYPAILARNLGQSALMYRKTLVGGAMSDLTSDSFELIISRVLRRCGYETIHAGRELISIATHSGGRDEVDIFAWNDAELLLVEAKFEIDPPGGWTPTMIEKRKKQLEKHIAQHEPKAAAWTTHLNNPGAIARTHPGDLPVELPRDLLAARSVRSIIISGRVEPLVSGSIEVRTFMPPMAAAMARKHLPAGSYCPIWEGTAPP